MSYIALKHRYITLDEVYHELQQIKGLLTKNTLTPLNSNDRAILLKLNGSQIKTYLLLEANQDYSANDVAAITHNSRAYESNILNQLVRLNLVTKIRKGRIVYFRKYERRLPNE